MKTLKAKQSIGPLVPGQVYLCHVAIGQIITATYHAGGSFWSGCCGVATLYKPSDFLAIYDYPTFGKARASKADRALSAYTTNTIKVG